MKRIFAFILLLLSVEFGFGQVKIINATSQKIFGGTGGIFMSYILEFKSKTSVRIEIDSVKSIADSFKPDFNFRKNEKGFYQISFGQVLSKPEKCKTCRDIYQESPNLTKGIIIYYRKGEKTHVLKAKSFKQLPDVMQP